PGLARCTRRRCGSSLGESTVEVCSRIAAFVTHLVATKGVAFIERVALACVAAPARRTSLPSPSSPDRAAIAGHSRRLIAATAPVDVDRLRVIVGPWGDQRHRPCALAKPRPPRYRGDHEIVVCWADGNLQGAPHLGVHAPAD